LQEPERVSSTLLVYDSRPFFWWGGLFVTYALRLQFSRLGKISKMLEVLFGFVYAALRNLFLIGLHTRAKVTVIAATNRPDKIDPALLRPGATLSLSL